MKFFYIGQAVFCIKFNFMSRITTERKIHKMESVVIKTSILMKLEI